MTKRGGGEIPKKKIKKIDYNIIFVAWLYQKSKTLIMTHINNNRSRKFSRYINEEIYELTCIFNETLKNYETSEKNTINTTYNTPENPHEPQLVPQLYDLQNNNDRRIWGEHTRNLPEWMLNRIMFVPVPLPQPETCYFEESEVVSGRWSPSEITAYW